MVTALKRGWQRLTLMDPDGSLRRELAKKYASFPRLLRLNHQVLPLMADMEDKLSGDYLFDLQYIRASLNQLHQETSALVGTLNVLGGNGYQELSQAWERLRGDTEKVLARRHPGLSGTAGPAGGDRH